MLRVFIKTVSGVAVMAAATMAGASKVLAATNAFIGLFP